MRTITASLTVIALALCAGHAFAVQRAQMIDGVEAEGRETLAAAGYQYDEVESLSRALADDNLIVAVFATTFLARQPPTPEVVNELRRASLSPKDILAVAAFRALQSLHASQWEDDAVALVYRSSDTMVQVELAGVLAEAGRSDGWRLVRDELLPDSRVLGLAVLSAARFDGLRTPDGSTIDVVTELRRLRAELQERGRSEDVEKVDRSTLEAEARGRARRQSAPPR